jgi:hypothetical protein
MDKSSWVLVIGELSFVLEVNYPSIYLCKPINFVAHQWRLIYHVLKCWHLHPSSLCTLVATTAFL